MEKWDTVIVGAGPAGLSLNWHLQRQGVRSIVLERHEVGASWRRMPSDFDLITPAQANAMPGQSKLADWHGGSMSCREYGHLLKRYAETYDLAVREDTPAERIEWHGEDGFAVVTGRETLHTRTVVGATGYFQNPHLPTIPTDDSVPAFHVSGLDDAKELAASTMSVESIVVVGRRISAGQAVALFHRLGYEVVISARRPIDYQPERDSVRRVRERVYFPVEELKARLGLLRRGDSYPMMQGGETRRLIESGDVPQIDRPRLISDGQVISEDGSATPSDLIVYATGFRPDLGFVGHDVDLHQRSGLPSDASLAASAERGFFFLGLDNLRTFRSRYLRGIRHDASQLATEIQSFLNTARPTPQEHVASET